MTNRIIYIFLFFISIVYSTHPNEYEIDSVEPNFQYRNGHLIDDLSSQSIVDLRLLNDESIVVGTSGGLGLIENDMSLYSFSDSNLPYGGNPALEVYNNEYFSCLKTHTSSSPLSNFVDLTSSSSYKKTKTSLTSSKKYSSKGTPTSSIFPGRSKLSRSVTN